MLVETFLRRLVVVRANAQHAVDALPVGLLQLFDHSSGVVASTAHEDGHTASHLLHHKLLDEVLLLGRQTRGLTGGSEYTEEVGAIIELIVQKPVKSVEIYRAISVERGNEGNAQTFKNVCCHKKMRSKFLNYSAKIRISERKTKFYLDFSE